MDQAVSKMIKGAKMTMQNAVLLQQEIHQLRTGDTCQKRKQGRSRHFIQNGGSLLAAEGLQRAQEEKEMLRPQPVRSHRPPKCSNCGGIGHDRIKAMGNSLNNFVLSQYRKEC